MLIMSFFLPSLSMSFDNIMVFLYNINMVNKMSTKYVISLDLDSTLLDDKKEISDETVKYFKKLTNDGHTILLNSGRPYQGTIRFLKRLGLDSPVIFSDGAGIAWFDKNYQVNKKILFSISRDAVLDIYKENEEKIVGINIVEFNNQYFNDKRVIPSWMFHEGEHIVLHEGAIDKILNTDPITITCVILKDGLDKFLKSMDKWKDEVEYFSWGEFDNAVAFEIFKKGVNKGSTLLYLCDLLGLDKNNIIAMGDNMNDLSMIKVAGIGCAMINGSESLKKQAKYITKYDCNNDGVRRFLEKIIK